LKDSVLHQRIVWISPLWKRGIRGDLKRKIGRRIKNIGLRVFRFSDKEVFKNTQGVLEGIWGICDS
jgi:very-short-patch-repair endonuclease